MERSDIPSPVSAARTLRRTELDLTRSLARSIPAAADEPSSSLPATASATFPVSPALASMAATEAR